jgi:hypothetical protein
MTYRKIFWGVILIVLGVLFILRNLNVIDFSWSDIWHFWPVLFILWGVSVLPVNDYIKLALSLVVVAATIYIAQNPKYNTRWNDKDGFRHHWEEQDEGTAELYRDQEFSAPWDDAIEEARLKFNAGAGEFKIEGRTEELVFLHAMGRADYSLESNIDNGVSNVDVRMRDYKGSSKKNQMDLSLNPAPVWEMEINCGAADFKADLREYKVRSLTLNGGAAALSLAFGDTYPETKVSIDAGASDLKILVPQSAGCEVKLNSVLSDRSLPGFDKVSSGLYRSKGYDKAANKIFIRVDVAVADLEISQY